MHCFTVYDLKATQMYMQHSLIEELVLYKLWKQPKTFVVSKVKVITVQKTNGSRYFAQITRTSTIRQGQVCLMQDSVITLQATEANLASNTQRISSVLDFSVKCGSLPS